MTGVNDDDGDLMEDADDGASASSDDGAWGQMK